MYDKMSQSENGVSGQTENAVPRSDRRTEERAAMSGPVKIERSGGNVFTDLGFPELEAENLMLRSELMSELRELARRVTRTKAAKRLGITQPRLNDLLCGKVDKFSLDALVSMVATAGLPVQLQVRKVA
jgi:predicted XRE-type DNA-binding protein